MRKNISKEQKLAQKVVNDTDFDSSLFNKHVQILTAFDFIDVLLNDQAEMTPFDNTYDLAVFVGESEESEYDFNDIQFVIDECYLEQYEEINKRIRDSQPQKELPFIG